MSKKEIIMKRLEIMKGSKDLNLGPVSKKKITSAHKNT